jgi:hypothetical protein
MHRKKEVFWDLLFIPITKRTAGSLTFDAATFPVLEIMFIRDRWRRY